MTDSAISQTVTWTAKFVDRISEVTDSLNVSGESSFSLTIFQHFLNRRFVQVRLKSSVMPLEVVPARQLHSWIPINSKRATSTISFKSKLSIRYTHLPISSNLTL